MVLLIGCASDPVDVSTTFDPLTPFPARATYKWDEAANKLPDDPRINQMETDSLIREAANAEFAARGYELSTTGSAHYKLSYDLADPHLVRRRTTPRRRARSRSGWSTPPAGAASGWATCGRRSTSA